MICSDCIHRIVCGYTIRSLHRGGHVCDYYDKGEPKRGFFPIKKIDDVKGD